MYNDHPKRFDRIVAIFIQLQSKRVVKAQELAERFDVSLRTIYRDIRTLEASGVPIYSEAGVGYSLTDGYRLAPATYTQEEAASFVAAEKLMQQFTDKMMQQHFSSAMYKMRAALRSNDKDWVASIESQVMMQPMQKKFNEKAPNALATLFESIARKTQVNLLYTSIEADTAVNRTIEPVGVFHQNNFWYVIAYCHLRKDYRQFRIDRIDRISHTDTPFACQHQALDFYLQPKEEKPKVKVVIAVDNDVARHLQWERNYHGFVTEELQKNKTIMHFEVESPEHGFARWFMMFGDKAIILEPQALKLRVQELLTLSLQKVVS